MNTVSLLLLVVALAYMLATGIDWLLGNEDAEPWVTPELRRDDREMWEKGSHQSTTDKEKET